MDVIVLTKVGGILGPFALIFGLVMNAIYELLVCGDTKCCVDDHFIYIDRKYFNAAADDQTAALFKSICSCHT